VRTPVLDALCKRGVNFRNAICPSPICGPSRACLASGYDYDRAGVRNNGDSSSPEAPNFYRQLRDAGYQVMTCGKLDLLKGEPDWGPDGQHAINGPSRLKQLGFTGGLDSAGKHAAIFAYRDGFAEPYFRFLKERGLAETHFNDFAARRSLALGPAALDHPGAGPNYLNTGITDLPDDAYSDNWIGACGLSLIEEAPPDKPWFLQVNLTGPHEPMDITRSMAESVADRDPPLPASPGGTEVETHRRIRRNYTAMIENIDAILGRYVETLRSLGTLDDTIIIFTSDHGEMLGDCGLWEKFVPHHASLHVPLVFAGPGVAEGHVVDGPATILDLHATITELAGAASIPGIDSLSMADTLRNPECQHRDMVFSGLGQWRVAYDGRFKIVAGFDPATPRKVMEAASFDHGDTSRWRLVDVATDGCETGDLSDQHPEVVRRLKQALLRNVGERDTSNAKRQSRLPPNRR
jgi:arylsulfatase A-like enzyme